MERERMQEPLQHRAVGPDTTEAANKPSHYKEFVYSSITALGETLQAEFGGELNLPTIKEVDLVLLDNAISLLTPPYAQVRVVEIDTFTESEQSIAKGNIPLDEDNNSYSLRQKAVVLKRAAAAADSPPEEPAALAENTPSLATAEAPAVSPGDSHLAELPLSATAQAPASAGGSAREAGDGSGRRELPEIIMFWGRNKRRGGNLVVCPAHSMDQLIEAYLVCEVVEQSIKVGKELLATRLGALMAVELGEGSPAEQAAIASIISDYSFHDASVGVVSLLASIYYFSYLARNDVNVLTLLAVAVVAGLNQEATWPWVFKLILGCSRIKDPIVRVAQCRRVHHHQGQLSGQAVLAIGLAVFGVYLEVVPTEDGHTPILFRILLNGFQSLMVVVLIINMVQALEPMETSNLLPRDRLRKWAKVFLDDGLYDKVWYLTLIVGLVWAGVIAAVVTQLSYEDENLEWDVFTTCLVVMALSLCAVNPGMALLSLWGLIWLVPVGLSLVFRSTFDLMTILINRVNVSVRRMMREARCHLRESLKGAFSVRDTLILLLQVLPITPLMLVFIPIPLLCLLAWLLHLCLRCFLRVADLLVLPISNFQIYGLLSDYGAVSWKMSRLTMDVEPSSMRTLLKRKVGMLRKDGRLGERVETGVLPCTPYAQLNHTSAPRLGCIAVEVDCRNGNRLRTGKEDLDKMLKERAEVEEDAEVVAEPDRDASQRVAPSTDSKV